MSERRLVYGVPASPPTVPPTLDELAEIASWTDITLSGDTPFGVTVGPLFPTTPAVYHRHFLTRDTTLIPDSHEEWFFWDPTRARWLSERPREFRFGHQAGGTDITLNNLGMGPSGSRSGFNTKNRPFVLVETYAMASAGGGDGTATIRLQSSSGQTQSIIAIQNNDVLFQNNRNILVAPSGTNEVWWCDVQGTVAAGITVHLQFHRTESNP